MRRIFISVLAGLGFAEGEYIFVLTQERSRTLLLLKI